VTPLPDDWDAAWKLEGEAFIVAHSGEDVEGVKVEEYMRVLDFGEIPPEVQRAFKAFIEEAGQEVASEFVEEGAEGDELERLAEEAREDMATLRRKKTVAARVKIVKGGKTETHDLTAGSPLELRTMVDYLRKDAEGVFLETISGTTGEDMGINGTKVIPRAITPTEVGPPYPARATMDFDAYKKVWTADIDLEDGHPVGQQTYAALAALEQDSKNLGEIERAYSREAMREYFGRQLGLDIEDPEDLAAAMKEYSDGYDPRRGIKIVRVEWSAAVKDQLGILHHTYTEAELARLDKETLERIALIKRGI